MVGWQWSGDPAAGGPRLAIRLALAALLALGAVTALGFWLIPLLPAPNRETRESPAVATVTPATPEQDPPTTPETKPVEPVHARPAPPPEGRAAVPSLPPLRDPPAAPKAPASARLESPKPQPKAVPPLPPLAQPKGLPGWKEGDVLWQEVVISRMSRYRVLGADMGQDAQYLLVSRFTVTKKEADGSLRIEQKVEGVRLDNADPGLREQLNDLLKKTRGATFEMTLNPRREVVAFKGGQEALKVFTGANPLGGTSFLLWSFLDQDGWKELAEVSFFRPREPVRKGDRWARPMTHSWGPLGSWTGQVGYVHLGRQGPVERYDYGLDLGYKPPAGAGGLPFAVGKADFRLLTARGAIGFDPERGRVILAEERFHVRGVLAVTALGVETAVEMDEAQLFQLRLHDRNPLEK